MKTRSPLKGMLAYSFYSASGNLSLVFLFCLLLGSWFLITGSPNIFMFFLLVAISFPPAVILLGGKGGMKWERFQITMPLKRKEVATANYLSIVIALIMGIVLIGIISSIGFALHENMLDLFVSAGLEMLTLYFALVLIATGLIYPLACTKPGKSKSSEQALFLVCMLSAAGIFQLVSWVGNRAFLSQEIISLLQIVIAGIVFIASYLITRRIYAKLDF
ncbi:MAG: ABC-2 transporter permease [Defluviitaleaceae bacterium]|nr:ABC-2 transporter permease [Defluviitaleaceae bacterium]